MAKISMSAQYPKANLADPAQMAQAVRNIQRLHDTMPPGDRREWSQWYPRMHDVIEHAVHRTGLTPRQGAALAAAVSPQTDWEGRNLPALGELMNLRQRHWDIIHRSAAAPGGRSPEATETLRGMSIASTSDAALVRAHRIIAGEDPDTVLNPHTAPKTHNFYHNLAEPDSSRDVTIDYRAHDAAINRMYPVEFNRGISQARLPSGRTTRYEHFEQAYRAAAEGRDIEHPHGMQAIVWGAAKRIEKSAPTKTGSPRVKGVSRKGQPYLPQ